MKSSIPFKALLFAAFICLLTINSYGKSTITDSPSKPDFAFPQKVTKDAEATLKKALSSNDDVMVLRSLIDLSIAQGMIDSDNIPTVYHKIVAITEKLTDQRAKSLSYLLQASILTDLYSNDRYNFDQRKIPLSPLPENINEWSGDQFRMKINQLLDKALENQALLCNADIKDYSNLITLDQQTPIYFPTLFDFISYQALDIINEISPDHFNIPAGLINQITQADIKPFAVTKSPVANKELAIYSSLIKANKDHVAPYLLAVSNCAQFIVQHLNENSEKQTAENWAELQLSLFHKYYPLSEYSGDILLNVLNEKNMFQQIRKNSDGEYSDKWFYTLAQDFIKRYPNYWRSGCVKDFVNNLAMPSVVIKADNYVEPDMAFNVDVNNTNAKDIYISIFKLKKVNNKNSNKWVLDSNTPVAKQELHYSDAVPFTASDNVTFLLPEPGKYYIHTSLTPNDVPNLKRSINGTEITCSSLAISTVSGEDLYVYSFNPATGVPIPDVNLSTTVKETINIGKTDKNGVCKISDTSGLPSFLRITPSTQNDKFGIGTSTEIKKGNDNSDLIKYNSLSFTDLPLFNPGDSVRWKAIIYRISARKENNHPAQNVKIKAYLQNANWVTTDSLEVSTNDFGQIQGAFLIPDGELTTTYRITYKIAEKLQVNERSSLSGTSFTVSDYKLPTFKIEIDKPVMNLPEKGDVVLKGRVISFSGVGLGNANVMLNLSSIPRFRYYDYGDSFFTDSITSAADGSFEFKIPAELLDESPYPNGLVNCLVTATTLSGESQNSKTRFSRENSYSISATLTDSKYVAQDVDVYDLAQPIDIRIEVTDAENKKTDLPVRLSIYNRFNDEDTKATPVFTEVLPSGLSKINLNALNPGRYKFKFSIADENLKEMSDSVETDYTLFRLKGQLVPHEKCPIWACMPKSNINLSPGEKAKIYYAVPTNNSYFIYTLSSGEKIYESRWIKADAGMHEMTVSLPEGVDNAKISLAAFRDFSSQSPALYISTSRDRLELKCESFRDNLIPGATETWTFRTVNQKDNPLRSALIMTMFDEALQTLSPMSYYRSFNEWYYSETSSSSNVYNYFSTSNAFINPGKYRIYGLKEIECSSLDYPQLNTYGHSFINIFYGRSLPLVSSPMMRKAATSKNASPAPMPESAATAQDFMTALSGEVSGLQIESPREHTYTYAAGIMADAADVVMEESVEYEPDMDSDGSEVSGTEQNSASFEYRENVSPLAFFRPLLRTDENGELTFSFTVPNANTTWRLSAFAYTESLMAASLSRTFIANKPIMVTPNLPRFLRTDDKAEISSLIINNSDKEQTIVTVTEIFNPLSGAIIDRFESTDTIPAGQNRSVTVTVSAPIDATAIGLRVKSSTPEFSDGEQSLIEILPSVSPVIETIPFYISPDSTHFEMTMPTIGKDARVTLEYCDNPTWYVVTALPGLRQEKMSTPRQAADAIYSAAIAEGLLNDNPTIADALKQWTLSDRSDSTLTSMLQRNADLKTMLLKATPWMVDAMTDTERMQRLALLFDNAEISETYNSAIDLLQRLQRDNAGWAWFSGLNEPSVWTTGDCLYTLGRLNRLGYLPKDKSLNKMIGEALSWYEAEINRQYKKYPRQDYMDFIMTLDLWPDFKQSLTTKKIISSGVQSIVKDWKKYSVSQKATAAILLSHNGYGKLARTVMNSVYEFAKSTPTQGVWWPSIGEQYGGSVIELLASANVLWATKEVMPESNYIDPVRQWLILQKEARNWGSGSATTDVIYAILSTSPKWIENAGTTEISVDSQKLSLSYSDKTLGYLRSDISAIAHSDALLNISKTSLTPSWGAIYAQSNQTMSDVKAAHCEAVSIEKRLYKLNAAQWEEATDLHVGDRIKIQLLIHANRPMQYMAIDDERAACFEPVEQLPAPLYSQGLCFYRENRDSSTNLFITNMPKGTYMLEYEMFVNNAGTFSSGIATIQSQYAPQLTAHSSGTTIDVASYK